MPSVPEHVQRIVALMIPLSTEDREHLAFRWLDRAMRVHLTKRLALVGRNEAAERVRALPHVSDRETCRAARDALASILDLGSPGVLEDMQTFTCALSVLGALRTHVTPVGIDVLGVVLETIMTALYADAGSQEAADQLREVELARRDPGLPQSERDRGQ